VEKPVAPVHLRCAKLDKHTIMTTPAAWSARAMSVLVLLLALFCFTTALKVQNYRKLQLRASQHEMLSTYAVATERPLLLLLNLILRIWNKNHDTGHESGSCTDDACAHF
jgi:hypothetical protein